MRAGLSANHRQQQTGTMSPEHILGKSMLKMSLQELQQFVETQIAQNPALVLDEEERCPACGCTLVGDYCPACGSEDLLSDADEAEIPSDDWEESFMADAGYADDEYYEPFARVASPKSLHEHLKEQLSYCASGDDVRIAEFLIECLDEDGYLRDPLVDIASRFGVSVPQLERVLLIVQGLDPAGVAARDLRECLLIQLSRIGDELEEVSLARTIISDHWDGFARMKLDRIASILDVEHESVLEALTFIRQHLTPHPVSCFRDPWSKLAPRSESKRAPDVRVRISDGTLITEMLDPVTGRVMVDDVYGDLYAQIAKKRDSYSESDRSHIRECVQTARGLIDALEFRKETIQRVAEELIRCQADFILKGPAFLKPLTKKELSQTLGVHESTVCRATTDKTMQLPSGEVIPFDTFFDSALPIREMVREFATPRPGCPALSDGEIADKLGELGIPIARRTVAKYRDQLRLLSVEYRVA